MLQSLKNIWREIYLQLTDTPAFIEGIPDSLPKVIPHMDKVVEQLDKALKDPDKKLIFLISPHGGGKTTALNYYLKNHPENAHIYKSFVKINDLSFAFLHLTSFIGRSIFIILSLIATYFLVLFLPVTGAIPFLLALGYFFAKNATNLIYIFHNTFLNLINCKGKLIVLEDLEKSGLSFNDQWALLSNLWLNKHRYLITLGYPSDQKSEKLRLLENIMKLKGTLIELDLNEEAKIRVAKQHYADFPFCYKVSSEANKNCPHWLSLFTPQELLVISEEVSLKTGEIEDWQGAVETYLNDPAAYKGLEKKRYKKKILYIETFLDLLAKKLGITHDEIFLDIEKFEIRGVSLEALSQEKRFYLTSFVESTDPTLGVKLNLEPVS